MAYSQQPGMYPPPYPAQSGFNPGPPGYAGGGSYPAYANQGYGGGGYPPQGYPQQGYYQQPQPQVVMVERQNNSSSSNCCCMALLACCAGCCLAEMCDG